MRVTGENPRRTVEVAGERAADTRAGAVSRGGGTPEARSVANAAHKGGHSDPSRRDAAGALVQAAVRWCAQPRGPHRLPAVRPPFPTALPPRADAGGARESHDEARTFSRGDQPPIQPPCRGLLYWDEFTIACISGSDCHGHATLPAHAARAPQHTRGLHTGLVMGDGRGADGVSRGGVAGGRGGRHDGRAARAQSAWDDGGRGRTARPRRRGPPRRRRRASHESGEQIRFLGTLI